MVPKKRRSTIQEWNAFIVNDFDAKGNYNFDPLCRQKMSGWTKKKGRKTQSWMEGGGGGGGRGLATTFVTRLRQVAEMNNANGKNIEAAENFLRILPWP